MLLPVKCELDQLASGLALFDVLNLIKSYPNEMETLFVHDSSRKLTADTMMALFTCSLSPMGSSRRTLEESLMQHLNEFLRDLLD